MKFSVHELSAGELSAVLTALGVGNGANNLVTVSATAPDAADEGAPNATPPVLDKEGVPWDARIHASTKAINADGSWRNRKGVDKALIASVEKEYADRHAAGEQFGAPALPVAMPVPPMPTPPVPQPQAAAPAMPTGPMQPFPLGQPPMMPVAPAPIAPIPPAPPAALDFTGLMQKVAVGFANGSMSQEILQAAANEISQAYQVQLTSITDISERPDMIDYADRIFKRDGRWQ